MWGLRGMDTSKASRWKPWERGELIVDDGFDGTGGLGPAAQEFVLDSCAGLRTAKCDADAGCPSGMLVRNKEVVCFMEAFKAYVEASTPGTDKAFPVGWWCKLDPILKASPPGFKL